MGSHGKNFLETKVEKSGLMRGTGTHGFFTKWQLSQEVNIKGAWLNGREEVKPSIVSAFKDILSDHEVWRSSHGGVNFLKLDDFEATSLEVSFTEEVHVVLTDLNGDKAPRPDGLTVAFWQFSWDVVKLDIMGLFKDCHERVSFARCLNLSGFNSKKLRGRGPERFQTH